MIARLLARLSATCWPLDNGPPPYQKRRVIGGQHPLNGWNRVYTNLRNIRSLTSVTVDHAREPIRQNFSAGEHVMEISGRSYGHIIDRIVLPHFEDTPYSENAFYALAESARADEPAPSPEPAVPLDPAPVSNPQVEKICSHFHHYKQSETTRGVPSSVTLSRFLQTVIQVCRWESLPIAIY